MQPIDFIDNSEFFRGLSKENKESLAGVSLLKRLRRKETLFMEGEKGHSLFLLANGGIRLFKTSGEGRDIVIRVMKPGEIFGEVVLFEEDVYPVSAEALKDSTIIMLPRDKIYSLLEKPSFRNDFIRMLMRKMRYLAEKIRYLSVSNPEERLIQFLATHFGPGTEHATALSKKDMAAAIGVAPETFSRLLLRLKKAGTLEWKGDTLRLLKSPKP